LIVAIDTSVLLLMFDPKARVPKDPATGQPLERAAERVNLLVSTMVASRAKILIPTPVLSELLVGSGPSFQSFIDRINQNAAFRVAPFDQRAAIEAALAHRDALSRGGFRVDSGAVDTSKSKIKFDRQIVAIAKVEGCSTVYSDDEDVVGMAIRCGMTAVRTADLDLPEQGSFDI